MTQVETDRGCLHEIDVIQDFYFMLTGCKMMLEGMSETPFFDKYGLGSHPRTIFTTLYTERTE